MSHTRLICCAQFGLYVESYLVLGFRVPKVVMYVSTILSFRLADFRNGFPQLGHPECVIEYP